MHKKFLFSLLAIMLLTVVVSACRIVDANTIPQNPAVKMGSNNFLVDAIKIKKGQSIDLVDTVASAHVIANGTWKNGTKVPETQPGAPDATLNFLGSETKTVGPFQTAGTFDIFCSIHPGMALKVTVSS